MEKINFKELVNPTFHTARETLELLAASGNNYAGMYLKELNLTQSENFIQDNKHVQSLLGEKGMKKIQVVASLFVEARYKYIIDQIKKDDCKNVLDLACGYAPKGYELFEAGIDYIGVDLPAVIDTMLPFSKKIFKDTKHDVYAIGDLTNPSSIKNIANTFNGEIAISSDGILNYFNDSELESMYAGIRSALLEHGGAWYCSDVELASKQMQLAAILFENTEMLAKLGKAMSMSQENSDIYFASHDFSNYDKELQFFEKNGLKVEKVPFYREGVTLTAIEMALPEDKDKLIEFLKTLHFWKITAIPMENVIEGNKQSEKLEINYNLQNDNLDFTLKGRLDTISAPKFMELYQNMIDNNKILKITIDMKELEYLSSTGLRVLLMMSKKLGQENVVVKNVNDTIREIFEASGFENVLNIER